MKIIKQHKEDPKIFSNLLTMVFDKPEKIRGMISCLSRTTEIKSETKMMLINKFDRKNNDYIKKYDSCKIVSLRDSIRYLEESINSDNPKHKETRKGWLKMLLFIEKNLSNLSKLHENPNNEELLQKLKSEKLED